jgi:F0F1-type ATP synthase membrane subunit b/b'
MEKIKLSFTDAKGENDRMPQIAQYITDIKQIISYARAQAYTAVNSAMVEAYWLIGERITEEEQQGKLRAEYGKEIIKNISRELQSEFGEGSGERSLRDYRQFYLTFKDMGFGTQCVPNLTWSHIRGLLCA